MPSTKQSITANREKYRTRILAEIDACQDAIERGVIYKREDYEALVSNEMREEVAALVEQIRDYSERMGNESTPGVIMTLNMLINQAPSRREMQRAKDATSSQKALLIFL